MKQAIFNSISIAIVVMRVNALAVEPPITDIQFTPDGNHIVAVSQVGVRTYSWPDRKLSTTIKMSSPNLHCLAFSPNGDRLAVGGGFPAEAGTVEIISWPEGKAVKTLEDHQDSVLSLAWKDQSSLVSASIDRTIKLWDFRKSSVIQSYKGHSRSVTDAILLNDQKSIVSVAHDQSVRFWSLESGELIRSMSQHSKGVHALKLRPAESGLPMVASAARDRTIRFWQPTIGRMVRYVKLESEPLDIGWLQNPKMIVAACRDGSVRVIDAEEVQVLRKIPAIEGWAYALAVHPTDGSVAVAGSNGQLQRIVLDSKE